MLDAAPDPAFKAICSQLGRALQALCTSTDWLLEQGSDGAERALAGATPYLRLFGTVAGGAMMARSALAAQAALESGAGDTEFLRAKIVTARFYAENILPQAEALVVPICDGHDAILAFPEDQF